MFLKNPDLVAISIVAIFGALLGSTGWHLNIILSIFGILLVLVLPGYLLSQLLFRNLPIEERLLITLGLSIVFTGLSGLLLHLTPWGLSGISWSIWLAFFILSAAYLLWKRRATQGETTYLFIPRNVLKFSTGIRKFAIEKTIARISNARHAVFLYGLATVFILMAYAIAQTSAIQLNTPLTILWAQPNPAVSRALDVGVRNLESKAITYHVVLQQNGDVVNKWTGIRLEPGKTFSAQFDFQQPPHQPVIVLLYRSDMPEQVYRRVKIDFPERPNQSLRK